MKESLIEVKIYYADQTVVAVLGLTEHGAGGREQSQEQNHSMIKKCSKRWKQCSVSANLIVPIPTPSRCII